MGGKKSAVIINPLWPKNMSTLPLQYVIQGLAAIFWLTISHVACQAETSAQRQSIIRCACFVGSSSAIAASVVDGAIFCEYLY
jgi:hypothetical protein